ncbi:MAG: hypothetical protein HQL36_00135 [Alphaproteobacteria bacterium]|nr:hypothetical protein [Alphaproteobacteria bacterium]
MKISVKQTQHGIFSVAFDDVAHTLTTSELKRMLMAAVKALSPGAVPTISPDDEARELGERLKSASPPGLQRFLMSVRDDDLLLLLKLTEDDQDLHATLFANMSQHKHTMLAEDLQYRFHDGEIPADAQEDALHRILQVANQLAHEGAFGQAD